MNSRFALYAQFCVASLHGLAVGYYLSKGAHPPQLLGPIVTLSLIALLYAWYYLDAEERSYRRTPLLGGSIILLSIVAVPYYLIRSRPNGARLKAVGKCAALAVLLVLVPVLIGLPFTLLTNGA